MKKPLFGTESILPVVALIFSLVNLTNPGALLSLSGLVSVIGIIGSILYFIDFHMRIVIPVLYIWIIVQIISVEPYFNLTQGFFNMGVSLGANDSEIVINIIPSILLSTIVILRASRLVGKRITISEFREGSLSDILPLEGTITKRMDFGSEKNWMLFKPDKPFYYDDALVPYVLIKRKDGKIIKSGAKNQIIFFRLVSNEIYLQSNAIENFPFIEWAICR
ncbi:hypothetical protein AAEO56_07500 [Flavobacterium sp. DGU11]|uniref:Uncharacterized protein n=1 Tax=Flavobacterium arundinis TaxID=3139143 RepID=A0ABU9HVA6_9FLAO